MCKNEEWTKYLHAKMGAFALKFGQPMLGDKYNESQKESLMFYHTILGSVLSSPFEIWQNTAASDKIAYIHAKNLSERKSS